MQEVRSFQRHFEPCLDSSARCVMGLLFGVALLAISDLTQADPTALEGSWRGVGRLTLTWGAKQPARCLADYKRTSETSYTLRAVCNTASTRVAQTATLYLVGENRYGGNFHNKDYNISGTIHLVVRSGKQRVVLRSDVASASFTLSRIEESAAATTGR
jgi:hypothetical protein